jgi:hypothetical protein
MMAILDGILQYLWEYSFPYQNSLGIRSLIRNPHENIPGNFGITLTSYKSTISKIRKFNVPKIVRLCTSVAMD